MTEELVQQLVAAKTKCWLALVGEALVPRRGKPCTPSQLAKIERRLGQALPPSYRAFLEVCNGISEQVGATKILSVEDQGRKWVKHCLQEFEALYYGHESAINPFQAWRALPIVLGEYEREYLVLDPRKVRSNGEMDFVVFEYGQEIRRFRTFTAYLRHELKRTRQLTRTARR